MSGNSGDWLTKEEAALKTGRPPVDPAKIAEAVRLRREGTPWSELETRLQISRRTVLRKSAPVERGQNAPEGRERE